MKLPATDELRQAVDRLGPAGVVGIALLAMAAALYLSALAPVRAELETLRTEVANLQTRLRSTEGAPRESQKGPAEQLATFYAFFPPPTSSPEWLKKINAIAEAKGLVLSAGDYKLERKPGARLARYQITLPVQGSYEQVRGFVGEVLAQVPAAVLDDVILKRDNVESRQLEARLRFSLYLGVGDGGA